MVDSDESSERVAIDLENLSSTTCHECGQTENKQEVLQTLSMVGAYDAETGEYVDGDSALDAGWELIVSAACDISRSDGTARVVPEEFYLFCPECPADPSVAVK